MPSKRGLVAKAFCGYLDVLVEDQIYLCKPRGILDYSEIFAGDQVEFEETESGHGIITKVLPRRNLLEHPHAANIDQVIIIATTKDPVVNLASIDKFLCLAAHFSLRPILCLNKIDLDSSALQLKEIYKPEFCELLFTSVPEKLGLEDLSKAIQGKTSVIVGPSGVGKSSLLNALHPEFKLKIGSVSEKNQHGKHTTRYVELLQLSPGTFVLDSPGFSNLDLDVPSRDLQNYFPEFTELAKSCRFPGCLHHEEPDCAVRNAAGKGLASSRYLAYITFLVEQLDREKNKYKRQYKSSYRKGTNKKWQQKRK